MYSNPVHNFYRQIREILQSVKITWSSAIRSENGVCTEVLVPVVIVAAQLRQLSYADGAWTDLVRRTTDTLSII